MSYRKSHVKNKIHRIKPKKSILKKLWFWVLILIFIIIGAIVYFLLFWRGIQVENISISGNNKITTQELQSIILSDFSASLLKLWNIEITSKSILLVNTENIKKEILQKFPVIEKISVNKNYPKTLTLGVTERIPVGVYCSSDCFLIDDNGIIFEPISTPNPDFFIVRQTIEDSNLYAGESVIGSDIINDVLKIKKDLQDNFQINTGEALITTPTRLNITTGEGWQIYFNLQGDPDINSQITKLNLLLNGDITTTVRKTLQYIDLRFQDRAFYK